MREKLNIIIVDDERIIREWIAMIIDKNSDNYNIVEKTGSGKRVLEVCTEEPIDIIISDIKMAPMDGLEIIREVKKISPDTSFIVLSNHDDFAYARQGLQLGVTDYLLKAEITDEDLIKCLDSVADTIREKYAANPGYEQKQLLAQTYLRQLVQQPASSDTARDLIDHIDAGIRHGNLFLLIFSADQCGDFNDGEQTALLQMIYQHALDTYETAQAFLFQNNIIVIVNRMTPAETTTAPAAAFARQTLSLLKEHCGSYSCALSGCFASLETLSQVYNATLPRLDHRFYTNGSIVIGAESVIHYNDARQTVSEILGRLSQLIGQHDYTTLYHYLIDRSQIIMDEHSLAPDAVRGLYYKILFDISKTLLNEVDPEALQQFSQESNKIINAPLFREIKEGTIIFLKQMLENLSAGDSKRTLKDEVLQYLSENYGDKVTLSTVARRAYLSDNYFSKIFKQWTGDNFNSYLTRLRINVAMQALSSTEKKIYEIAEDVGFQNVGYFTQVFRKATGISPKEYRKQTETSKERITFYSPNE